MISTQRMKRFFMKRESTCCWQEIGIGFREGGASQTTSQKEREAHSRRAVLLYYTWHPS